MDFGPVREALQGDGLRMTREREALLRVFMTSATAMTPAELHARAREAGRGVGLTTAYRLLETLTRRGMATPILVDGAIRYAFCEASHHHHFICLQCHRVEDIHGCAVPASLRMGRSVAYHRLDLFGRCEACLGGGAGC